MKCTSLLVLLVLPLFLAGCDGMTEPSRTVPRAVGADEGWNAGLWESVIAIGMAVANDVGSAKDDKAMRPQVRLRAPGKAAVNELVTVEAAYRDKGKVVSDWWVFNCYTVFIRNEKSGAEVKPESEEHRTDGRLVVTFKADEPGSYEVEVKTWAAGTDPATSTQKAVARRTVKMR